jgi:hypothetical protein
LQTSIYYYGAVGWSIFQSQVLSTWLTKEDVCQQICVCTRSSVISCDIVRFQLEVCCLHIVCHSQVMLVARNRLISLYLLIRNVCSVVSWELGPPFTPLVPLSLLFLPMIDRDRDSIRRMSGCYIIGADC